MRELGKTIPDVRALLALEPEELGAKLIFLMRQNQNHRSFMLAGIQQELYQPPDPVYPTEHQHAVYEALTEAWCWLEAQGLLVPPDPTNGQNGWRKLSRRARKYETTEEFNGFIHSRHLPKEALHPSISQQCWLNFIRGEYDIAVFVALRQVEISVREAAGFDSTEIGVPLMRKAFHKDNGPLTDLTASEGEREARQHLFAGAIGSYKNPPSHRDLNLTDPIEAIEVIILASHLLRIIDSRRE